MNTTFKIKEITDRRNGYNMPVVVVTSNTNLDVINRGWNEFNCKQIIDESELMTLRTKFPESETTLMLEIETPTRKTNCWYELRTRRETNNIIW